MPHRIIAAWNEHILDDELCFLGQDFTRAFQPENLATAASGVALGVGTPPAESPPKLTKNPLQLIVNDRDIEPLEFITPGEPKNEIFVETLLTFRQ